MEDLNQSEVMESGTTGEPAAADPGAGVGTLDLEKFKSEILGAVNSSFDERFKGFQKTLSKRDQKVEELERQLREANRVDLTEDERVALDVQEKDAQIARLQMALELKELSSEFPDVAPHFSRILEADSPRAQMEILQSVLHPKKEETAQEQPSEQAQPASVDPTNPPADSDDGLNYEAMFEKDPSLLDRILKGTSRLRNAGE